MPMPLRLEDFGGAAAQPKSPAYLPNLEHSPGPPAAVALDAFDKGYAAGWDDATKAAEATVSDTELALRQGLEDLGFTYHEARVHVMGALTPLLNGVVKKLLPTLLHETLGQRILEEVESMADSAADLPVDLMAAPIDVPALRPVVEAVTALPLRLVEEKSVLPGQMFLRIGKSEREIDLSSALASISSSLSALNSLNSLNGETLRHG